jgi:serine/threonine-protein kinase RsbW
MKRPAKGSAGSSRVLKVVRKDNQIVIPSSLEYLPKVDVFVENKLKKLGIDKDQIADVAISVSEAVTNAVVHGNKNDFNKTVWISLKADSSSIEVTVEDEGGSFDPICVESPIEAKNLLKKAGRGIFILTALMDKVEYSCEPNKGTRVKMTKFVRKDGG